LRIDIRPWVFRLAVLAEDTGGDFEDHRYKFEQRVEFQARSRKAELALTHVPWIGLAQDSMTVARNDLAGFERIP
jgi:hypothetical protein